MTVHSSIDFDGASPPTAVSTANTPELNTVTGAAALYNASIPSGGTNYSALVTGTTTSFHVDDFTSSPDEYFEFYFKLNAVSPGTTTICTWFNSTTTVGDLRLMAGAAQLQIRDNITGKGTSTTFALGTWHRVVIHCDVGSATGHSLKIFEGANRDGATPNYDSGNQTATSAGQTAVTRFRFGMFNAGQQADYNIHRIRIQDTAPTGGGGGGSSLLPYAVDFTGVADGEQMDTTNTPSLSAQSGLIPTFSNIVPPGYNPTNNPGPNYSALVDFTAQSDNTFNFGTETLAWMGFYFRFHAVSTTNSKWCQWTNNAGTNVGEIRMEPDNQLHLRDNVTSVATSQAITLSSWHRMAIYCDPGSATGHRFKLYLGANRHGTTADYDSGGVASTSAGATDVARFRFGVNAASNDAHYRIARIRVDATEPAGLTASGYDVKVAKAGVWVGTSMKHATGSAWVS